MGKETYVYKILEKENLQEQPKQVLCYFSRDIWDQSSYLFQHNDKTDESQIIWSQLRLEAWVSANRACASLQLWLHETLQYVNQAELLAFY